MNPPWKKKKRLKKKKKQKELRKKIQVSAILPTSAQVVHHETG